jgi:ABC-type glycerol-3-phosphate transport system substrate-binding protein
MKLRLLTLLSVFVLVAAACGGDDEATADTTEPVTLTNACPVDGCSITITDVQPDGDELRITWETNFAPEFSKNHIHLYWDTYTAKEVSANAESEHGVTQGNWLPTDAWPELVTEGAVSVAERAGSTMLCVTAADFEHIVLDLDLVKCFDVSDSL